MNKHIFWRLFKAAVLTAVVWSAINLEVYGWNDSGSGGTLLDVFRGRSNSSNTTQTMTPPPMQSNAPIVMPAPQMTTVPSPQMTPVPAPQMTNVPAQPNDYVQPYETVEGARFPSSQYVPPAVSTPQPAVQNKWSLKNLFNGSSSNQPQYGEPMPTPAQPFSHSHTHGVPSVPNSQYRVVPLDSEDFQPQEGAIYNEKGEMIYNPESGGPLPDGVDGATIMDNNNAAMPLNEPERAAKRVIVGGRTGAGRPVAPVNQERIYNQQNVYPNGAGYPAVQPAPAQMPVNPYAQQPTAGAGNPPVGMGNSVTNQGNSGMLKLDSGSTAFSRTYKPLNRMTNVPTEPVMDMAGPALAEALPQVGNEERRAGDRQETSGVGNFASENSNSAPYASRVVPGVQPTPQPAKDASPSAASPVIEDLSNASPLENLSQKSAQTPVLEPVPVEDVTKETAEVQSPAIEKKTPEVDKKTVVSEPQESVERRTISKEKTQNASQNALADRSSQVAAEPLILEIAGPEEVEFGKNEMFSLSVINTTDAVRQDIELSVHPEGFGDDKTASLNLEQLAPGEKRSISMKLNARQYNNLSLTAHVRDALGYETTKKISVNVKNESVKISILPPQAGNAYVGQPTQYIIRIVNNAPKVVSLNAVAFFGNGIEPIRATGAPNTIQSGQVVVDKPIELKQGEMRDLKIVAVAFQPGIHKILVQLLDSRGATYAAKESCAYRQREFDEDETETIETDARIELTPGKSEIGVWKAAKANPEPAIGNREPLDEENSETPQAETSQDAVAGPEAPSASTNPEASPALNAPDAVPLTQPDQGSKGDLIMPMFAQ